MQHSSKSGAFESGATEPGAMTTAATDYFFGPMAVLTAIVFGSAVAIEFGLVAAALIFWLVSSESPQVASEVGRVPVYAALFLLLCVVSGLALYSALKRLAWQWYAQAGMWSYLALMAWWFTRKSAG